jgi:hypothetical protein
MLQGTQSERDAISFQLLESLKGSLQSLEDLRLVPHNDAHVLRLKQYLRQKIAETERKLAEIYGELTA